MKIKKLDFTKKHKIIFLCLSLMLVLLSYLSNRYIGINISKSVPFITYIKHDTDKISYNDYVLFKFPKNQLYKVDTLAVKQIKCMQGQILNTINDNQTIVYTCDNKIISHLTIFKRPNGEQLNIFKYNGIIPKHSYFVTGSAYESYDSRYWGFIKRNQIIKKVTPLVLNFASYAYAEEINSNFYDERDKGWYKYETTPAPIEKTEKEHIQIKPVINWNKLETMPVKEFAELFDKVQDYAMTYRTLENFDTYAKMRAVMFKRSQEFMNVSILWGQLNPVDSSENWFPSSSYGQQVYQAVSADIKTKYIRDNSEYYGLIYFYRDDCPYCQKQRPLIKYFEDENHWKIKKINTTAIPEAMMRFNIQSVPSIILVERKTGNWMPVSNGLITYDDIQDRVYRTIKYLKGETNEKTFADIIKPNVNADINYK